MEEPKPGSSVREEPFICRRLTTRPLHFPESFAAASGDLLQAGIRGILGTNCDHGVVVPENLITVGVEFAPHQASFAEVESIEIRLWSLSARTIARAPAGAFPRMAAR